MTAGTRRIPVGVSSCLLGEKVRYDGDDQLQPYIASTLGKYFDFRPFCPEVAIGLGVPRPPIRLVATDGGIECRGQANKDYTQALRQTASEQGDWHRSVCAYIFKQASPSCGVTGVKVYRGHDFRRAGTGIYARELMRRFPELPVAEETTFDDLAERANFIQCVFVMDRWQQLLSHGLSVAALTDFHARHKLVLLSHCQKTYRELNPILSQLNGGSLRTLADAYIRLFMRGLRKIETRGNHVNVLQHLQGYLKDLDDARRSTLNKAILDYQHGRIDLIGPLTLLRQHFEQYPHPWAAASWYLYPDPREIELIDSP